MAFSAQLVLRANEIYHDVEEAEYAGKHPEIFERESARWRWIGQQFIAPHPIPLCVLDVGCGTGFVATQIGPFLKTGDLMICSDLSARMLDVCRRSIEQQNLPCECRYMKLDGHRIPIEKASCDFVTMNSVLHHVPDVRGFLGEIGRVLKVDGRVVIAHEPNRHFYQHPFLWHNSRMMAILLSPRRAAGSLLRRLHLIDLVRRLLRPVSSPIAAHGQTVSEVNRRLMTEGLISMPLTVDEMTGIVDVHSPTAGGIHRERGIDIQEILPGFELELIETYNHLGDAVMSSNRFARRYDEYLRTRFPTAGATLLAVLRKKPGV